MSTQWEVKKKGSTFQVLICSISSDSIEKAEKFIHTFSSQEETKRIIQDHPFSWCKEQSCDLKLYQNGKNLYAGSEEGGSHVRNAALVDSFTCAHTPAIYSPYS